MIDLSWRSSLQAMCFGPAWAIGCLDRKAWWAEHGDETGNVKGCERGNEKENQT